MRGIDLEDLYHFYIDCSLCPAISGGGQQSGYKSTGLVVIGAARLRVLRIKFVKSSVQLRFRAGVEVVDHEATSVFCVIFD